MLPNDLGDCSINFRLALSCRLFYFDWLSSSINHWSSHIFFQLHNPTQTATDFSLPRLNHTYHFMHLPPISLTALARWRLFVHFHLAVPHVLLNPEESHAIVYPSRFSKFFLKKSSLLGCFCVFDSSMELFWGSACYLRDTPHSVSCNSSLLLNFR